MYSKLFQMCGFTQAEIDEQRPRIDKVLERIGVTTKEAVREAEECVQANFDVELNGTRQFLWVFMNEFLDAVLARDENDCVVYSNLPIPFHVSQPFIEAVKDKGSKVYVGCALDMCWQVLGPVFNQVNDLLEAGELLGQTAGRAHCSHYQINAGLYEKGIIPKPDLLIGSGLFCDQSAEADELTSKLYDFPTVYIDGLNDWNYGTWPELEEHGVQYVREKLVNAYRTFEEATGVPVTEEHLAKGLTYVGKTTMGWQNLVDMVAKIDPQPISQADITLPFYIWSLFNHYEPQALAAFNAMMRDVNKRKKEGKGVVPKGAPSVYVQLRTNCDTRPMKTFEELGLRVPMMFFDKMLPETMAESQYTDLYSIVAEALYKIPIFAGTESSIEYWERMCKMNEVDGMIMWYQFSCRPWCAPPLMGKRAIQERLGIPVLIVEGDSWDSRNYSHGQLRTRVESFAEVLKMNKAAQMAA